MLTRRDFLRSAGGVTALALTPIGKGLFAAPVTTGGPRLPLFTVTPYIQPGSGSLLHDGGESVVVAWQTLDSPADFAVDFGSTDRYERTATCESAPRPAGHGGDTEARRNWSAALSGLSLGHKYFYRVRGYGQMLAEGYFTTRQPRGRRIRFVSFGDNSYGDISDRAIAYHTYQQHPDFVMNCGDNVYESGTDDEYQRYFFPVYNADVAGSRVGAPLLRSVPFYTVIANHDVQGKDENGHEVADFSRNPDALAYYTAMHLPLNGPETPTYVTPTIGPADRIASFHTAAGARFPRMANYSFDYGDAHFLCLDSNRYIDPNDETLQAWIAKDLSSTDAIWTFVVFHHPPFNVGNEHYEVQHMRVLAPLFERHGVDIVLSGHEHNYQRPRPLRFKPTGIGNSADVGEKDRRVSGRFTVDRLFDGNAQTHADGVLYIVTGAGGKHLYDAGFTDNPSRWTHADDANVDYVVKMVTDRHSFSLFDVDGPRLTMTQIDEAGSEIDRITMTKKGKRT
ncbi:MAG TPA: metallophosphoesterase [Vicinamibacterales bacterium]|nr:metallophosphoesterase [Vicinamibacterales bacterium]